MDFRSVPQDARHATYRRSVSPRLCRGFHCDAVRAGDCGRIVRPIAAGAAELDCFKITGKGGQSVLADCRARRIDSRLDPSLELYTATGRKVASSHNQYRRDAVLDYTLPEDGDYFIRVSDFVYGGGNDYF